MHTLVRERPGRPLVIRMAYGVATNNIFDLLDEENEDPQALASKPAGDDENVKSQEGAHPQGEGGPKNCRSASIRWYCLICRL